MPSYSKNDVILVSYPFSNLSATKVRPGIIISISHPSQDVFITPLTSRTQNLLPGEFVLTEWQQAGLNTLTAVKRGIFTIEQSLIIKKIGILSSNDRNLLTNSLCNWLGLPQNLN
ncbi:MAG: type II toxin-antitoxin system PemK/MazF family toxin [Crocosphaera sp.]|nr:type II toxin-antitoxin system PemK/MazF family toxin [Crocosphaera sp.]